MSGWGGTVVSVKGNKRAGDVEMEYAKFLNQDSSNKGAIKQGTLKKKAASSTLYEKWNDRQVVLRGLFLSVGKINLQAQSKLYMLTGVSRSGDSEFNVSCHGHDKIFFRGSSTEERDSWVNSIRRVVDSSGIRPLQSPSHRAASPLPVHGTRKASLSSSRDNVAENEGQMVRPRFPTVPGVVAHNAPEGPKSTPELELRSTTKKPPPASISRDDLVRVAGPSHIVGIFWDCTTIMPPKQDGSNNFGSGTIREFAERHGGVDSFIEYREDDPKMKSGCNLRKRIDKDVLLWLWDHSRKSTAEVVVVLISDRDFLRTSKEIVRRGTKVIVINSHMEKAEMIGDTALEFRKITALWPDKSTQKTLTPSGLHSEASDEKRFISSPDESEEEQDSDSSHGKKQLSRLGSGRGLLVRRTSSESAAVAKMRRGSMLADELDQVDRTHSASAKEEPGEVGAVERRMAIAGAGAMTWLLILANAILCIIIVWLR